MRTFTLILVSVLLAAPARAEDALGKLDFPVTGGTAEARQHFQRGLLAIHSFWYDEAEAEMDAAVKADPTFAMGLWGQAFSRTKLFWRDDDLAFSRAALAKITAPEKLTAMEREWIDATRALYADGSIVARRQAFASALEKMHAEHPKDDEVTTFLAVSLLSSRMPHDPDELAVRARAASLAMEVFQRNPKHPGAAHYIIHALDTYDLAPLALPAARLYASIAPEAFHARHMPAHIFSRLGMWKEALASCQSAWDASVASSAKGNLGVNGKDFHSLNWSMLIDFQLGRRKDADAILKLYTDELRAGMNYGWRSMYIYQADEYMAQTGEWSRADELLAPLSSPVVDPKEAAHAGCAPQTPQDVGKPAPEVWEKASLLYTRADASARLHDVAAVKKQLAELDKLRAQTRPYRERQLGKEELARQDKMDALERTATLALARGDDKAALAAMRKQAEEQDKQPLGEWAIFSGGIHEDIAETLLRLGRGKEALAEYREVLRRHPSYARALLGAARAAAKAGDAAAARGYYSSALDVWAGADPDFPGVEEARKAVGAARAD